MTIAETFGSFGGLVVAIRIVLTVARVLFIFSLRSRIWCIQSVFWNSVLLENWETVIH